MKKRDKTQWLWGLAGLALTALAVVLQRSSIDGSARRWMKVLSDGTLLAGAVLVVIALVTLCARTGLFTPPGMHSFARRNRSSEDTINRFSLLS